MFSFFTGSQTVSGTTAFLFFAFFAWPVYAICSILLPLTLCGNFQ